MEKNERPEGTREKILSVAQQLFHEKGYDNTTVQDIIDGLGGMTKGVIYHHFKSKEEIMQSVMERYDVPEIQPEQLEERAGGTGLEKLRQKMISSLQDTEKLVILFSAKALMRSPRIIGEVYLACLKRADQVQEYINEGIEDGSIVTDYPTELAEFIPLIVDMGFVLNFPRCSKEEIEGRLRFVKNLFESINVPLVNDEILNAIFQLYDHINARKQRRWF